MSVKPLLGDPADPSRIAPQDGLTKKQPMVYTVMKIMMEMISRL